MSLFLTHGGRKRKATVPFPSEKELLALATGLVAYWCKNRDSTHPQFYMTVSLEVQRAGCTEQEWDHATVRLASRTQSAFVSSSCLVLLVAVSYLVALLCYRCRSGVCR